MPPMIKRVVLGISVMDPRRNAPLARTHAVSPSLGHFGGDFSLPGSPSKWPRPSLVPPEIVFFSSGMCGEVARHGGGDEAGTGKNLGVNTPATSGFSA